MQTFLRFCVILAAMGALLGIVPYVLIYYIIEFFLSENPLSDVLFYMITFAFGAIILKYILTIPFFFLRRLASKSPRPEPSSPESPSSPPLGG